MGLPDLDGWAMTPPRGPSRAATPEIAYCAKALELPVAPGHEPYLNRVLDLALDAGTFRELATFGRGFEATDEFRAVIDYFAVPDGRLPAGFAVRFRLGPGGRVAADLRRDISYGADGCLRPTPVLYSADSANPYEVAPIAPYIANLTCNPGIVYDLFLNNPEANVGRHFKDRDEVIGEIGRILGPGCDISVELDNPFEQDPGRLLEEAEHFREMLSRWRVVIKVPHTGPVGPHNVSQLLDGDRRLEDRWWEPNTADAFRGHRLALMLREHGFRVNFTLMFEPHQTGLALQARPYFINSFVRHRLIQSRRIAELLGRADGAGDDDRLAELRDYLIATDYLSPRDSRRDLGEVREIAETILELRRYAGADGSDGLDGVRHNLRLLRNANLPDTRLIVCSMQGPRNYPDIDRLLAEPEFADMSRRVVVTAEPSYLARFTSANQVISYQRRFTSAVRGA
jgi:hypothetical protein